MPRSPDGTPSSSLMTREGIGSAKSSTRSVGGPAASMSSSSPSMICWSLGTIAATRLTEKCAVNMRRTWLCSGSSLTMKGSSADSRLTLMPALCEGCPGRVESALKRGSERMARWSAYRVTSQAICPFQIRTGVTGSASRSAAYCGGGSKGQPVARAKGKSGTVVPGMAVSVMTRTPDRGGGVPLSGALSRSEPDQVWTSMAAAGHRAAASRARSSAPASGAASSRTTTPSSSRWSKRSSAASTH